MKKTIILFLSSTATLLSMSIAYAEKVKDGEFNYLQNKILETQMAEADNLSFLQYRKNYLVFSSLLNGVNQEPISSALPDTENFFSDYELQFQISFMVPMAVNMFDSSVSLYGAYTNRSFWQVFDDESSRPFRETNHEPELWVSWFYDLEAGDLNVPMIWFGFRHQSNGQFVSLTRGWNRLYVNAFADYHRWSFSAIYWERLRGGSAEDRKYDYEKFIGNGELLVDYAFVESTVSLTYSYSFSGFDFGSVMLEYSHNMLNAFDFYVRYFNGYGESLIDVEYKSNTLSMGVMVNEW